MLLKTHVTAPGSTNSERLTAKPAREGFVFFACTEPIETGIGAVCVERVRPKWSITMLTDTKIQRNTDTEKIKMATYAPRMTRYEDAFFVLGKPRTKRLRASRLARLIITYSQVLFLDTVLIMHLSLIHI